MLWFLKTNMEEVAWDRFAGPATTCRMGRKAGRRSSSPTGSAPHTHGLARSRLSDELSGWSHGVYGQEHHSPDSHEHETFASSSSHLPRPGVGWGDGEVATSPSLIFHLVPNVQPRPPSAAWSFRAAAGRDRGKGILGCMVALFWSVLTQIMTWPNFSCDPVLPPHGCGASLSDADVQCNCLCVTTDTTP